MVADAVKLSTTPDGVAIVALEDRASSNTFTPSFIDGLMRAFDAIRSRRDLKVVVVHGYDTYFCCGGTKEELIAILEGRLEFADSPFYDLLLQCELPVIAAMQGHALGGGLVLGCYADLIVMAEESLYGAVFMKYGFTPGMGGTYIVPKKLGDVLGSEMLFTARNFYGHELKARGIPARVVRRAEVVATAMSLARDLADKPRLALTELKKALADPIRAALPAVVANELAMHRVTFAQPEIRARIESLFGR
jgi:polyketide biosynthesis enoyl-CoA hydratase PksI